MSGRQVLVFLIVLTAIFSIGQWFCAAHAFGPSRATDLLWSFQFRLILTWWVFIDRRAREFSAPFEFDAFVFFAWPFVFPYYAYRTRGSRGLILVAGVYGLAVVPYVTAQIARMVLNG